MEASIFHLVLLEIVGLDVRGVTVREIREQLSLKTSAVVHEPNARSDFDLHRSLKLMNRLYTR